MTITKGQSGDSTDHHGLVDPELSECDGSRAETTSMISEQCHECGERVMVVEYEHPRYGSSYMLAPHPRAILALSQKIRKGSMSLFEITTTRILDRDAFLEKAEAELDGLNCSSLRFAIYDTDLPSQVQVMAGPKDARLHTVGRALPAGTATDDTILAEMRPLAKAAFAELEEAAAKDFEEIVDDVRLLLDELAKTGDVRGIDRLRRGLATLAWACTFRSGAIAEKDLDAATERIRMSADTLAEAKAVFRGLTL